MFVYVGTLFEAFFDIKNNTLFGNSPDHKNTFSKVFNFKKTFDVMAFFSKFATQHNSVMSSMKLFCVGAMGRAEIYPSNFNVCYTVQKTQSYN